MLARSTHLLKQRNHPPIHPVARVVRSVSYTPRFICNRRPYSSAAAVATLLRPLLFCRSCGSPTGACGCAATPVTALPAQASAKLEPFLAALESAPVSVEADGPIHKDVIREMAAGLSSASVEAIQASLFGGALSVGEHRVLRDYWTGDMRAAYGAAIVAEREAHIKRRHAAIEEPRFEAGCLSHSFFGAFPSSSPHDGDSWATLVDTYTLPFGDRSWLHELENLPQEIAIGEILRECVGVLRKNDCGSHGEVMYNGFVLDRVVDIGGGNGFLTAAVAEHLGCPGVVVDPYYPGHSVDCLPSKWRDTPARQREKRKRSQPLSRLVSFFRDVRWRRDIGGDGSRAAVVAKHLCGSGIDECLIEMEKQAVLPPILVLAPCCFPKIKLSTYCNGPFLQAALGVDTQAGFDRFGAMTDWNMSCTQHAKELTLERGARRPAQVGDSAPVVEREHSFPYKRVGAYHSVARTIPCMHALSQLIEAVVNHGRVLWLCDRGYDACTVQYVPNQVSPKCKCIVAVKSPTVACSPQR